jgi:hypothetical protein
MHFCYCIVSSHYPFSLKQTTSSIEYTLCLSFSDGLRGHFDQKSTGLWLFKRNTYTPLKGVNFHSGFVAEWDPEFPLGLAIVVPSDEVIPDEENTQALKMHFGGRRNLLKNSNVVFLHSEKSRTDKRIKARCYFRIRPSRTMTAPATEAVAQANESTCNALHAMADSVWSVEKGLSSATGVKIPSYQTDTKLCTISTNLSLTFAQQWRRGESIPPPIHGDIEAHSKHLANAARIFLDPNDDISRGPDSCSSVDNEEPQPPAAKRSKLKVAEPAVSVTKDLADLSIAPSAEFISEQHMVAATLMDLSATRTTVTSSEEANPPGRPVLMWEGPAALSMAITEAKTLTIDPHEPKSKPQTTSLVSGIAPLISKDSFLHVEPMPNQLWGSCRNQGPPQKQ